MTGRDRPRGARGARPNWREVGAEWGWEGGGQLHPASALAPAGSEATGDQLQLLLVT